MGSGAQYHILHNPCASQVEGRIPPGVLCCVRGGARAHARVNGYLGSLNTFGAMPAWRSNIWLTALVPNRRAPGFLGKEQLLEVSVPRGSLLPGTHQDVYRHRSFTSRALVSTLRRIRRLGAALSGVSAVPFVVCDVVGAPPQSLPACTPTRMPPTPFVRGFASGVQSWSFSWERLFRTWSRPRRCEAIASCGVSAVPLAVAAVVADSVLSIPACTPARMPPTPLVRGFATGLQSWSFSWERLFRSWSRLRRIEAHTITVSR